MQKLVGTIHPSAEAPLGITCLLAYRLASEQTKSVCRPLFPLLLLLLSLLSLLSFATRRSDSATAPRKVRFPPIAASDNNH